MNTNTKPTEQTQTQMGGKAPTGKQVEEAKRSGTEETPAPAGPPANKDRKAGLFETWGASDEEIKIATKILREHKDEIWTPGLLRNNQDEGWTFKQCVRVMGVLEKSGMLLLLREEEGIPEVQSEDQLFEEALGEWSPESKAAQPAKAGTPNAKEKPAGGNDCDWDLKMAVHDALIDMRHLRASLKEFGNPFGPGQETRDKTQEFLASARKFYKEWASAELAWLSAQPKSKAKKR